MTGTESAAAGIAAQLVRAPAAGAPEHSWEQGPRRLLDAEQGFTRVLGAPGTGKTSLLVELAARRIASGDGDPQRVLVLTASRRAADAVRSAITQTLTARFGHGGRTIREPLVRTVHSYAFAVLRLRAARDELPAPRLLSAPEQDVIVRDLLDGDIEDGAHAWPERLRPALAVPGFAEELRDLLSRAAERGLGPADLEELGRSRDRPEWVAAGRFWHQYEEVTLLRSGGGHALAMPGAQALDAAELVSGALLAFADEPTLRTAERERVRHILVDDAQHLDPLQYRLVRELGHGARDFVLAGDPDQSVFSFRGADPALLDDADPDDAHTITLATGHRMAPAVRAGVLGPGRALPRHTRRREATPAREAAGAVRTRLFPTPAAEASWVADQLRRAHLLDGVPYSSMSVLLRAPARSLPVLHRALRTAGVPVGDVGDDLPLASRPAVRPLLFVLRAVLWPRLLNAELAEMLLSSPLGGADPMALRKLRRGLRRLEAAAGGERSSDELLVLALRGEDVLAGLGDAEAGPVRRVVHLLATVRTEVQGGAGAEQVLWQLWQESGLRRRWLRQAERGGSLGAKADRDLDDVVALFHAAGRYADRLPRGSVQGFVDYLSAQHITGDSVAPAAAPTEGVALLSAHAAAGREWTVVALPGMQEGSWPDLRLRGSVLGVEKLVDVLSGVDGEGVSTTAPLLAEERRLCYLAASRARDVLLISAVSGEDEQPSRFLDELSAAAAAETGNESDGHRAVDTPERALSMAELVGELRRVSCDGMAKPDRRRLAARQLARLAEAGVPGAHPDSWYGLLDASTDTPMRAPGEPLDVSPSTVDTLVRCPLRWLLERHGGSDPAQLSAVTGTLVHTLAQQAADGADDAELRAALDEAWHKVDAGAPWFSRRERARVQHMVDNFVAWMRASRGELTQQGLEQGFSAELPPLEGGESEDDSSPVRLRGRVDRLELDEHGRPVIIDLKTGKSPVSRADASEHPQLAAYQLAALVGAFTSGSQQPGGARLVYVAKSHNKQGATEREQPALDDETGRQWLELVRTAARSTRGPGYTARENQDCARCPGRKACPLRPEGRQVSE